MVRQIYRWCGLKLPNGPDCIRFSNPSDEALRSDPILLPLWEANDEDSAGSQYVLDVLITGAISYRTPSWVERALQEPTPDPMPVDSCEILATGPELTGPVETCEERLWFTGSFAGLDEWGAACLACQPGDRASEVVRKLADVYRFQVEEGPSSVRMALPCGTPIEDADVTLDTIIKQDTAKEDWDKDGSGRHHLMAFVTRRKGPRRVVPASL